MFSYELVGNAETFEVPGLPALVRLTVISPRDLARLDFVDDSGAPAPVPRGAELFTVEELIGDMVPCVALPGPCYAVSSRTEYGLRLDGDTVFRLRVAHVAAATR